MTLRVCQIFIFISIMALSALSCSYSHERKKVMTSGKALLGVVSGAAAGAVLGLLFAPAKDLMTRKKAARNSAHYAEVAREMFGEYIDVLADEYSTVKKGAANLVDRAREQPASGAGADWQARRD
jgi:gas vesicle protein